MKSFLFRHKLISFLQDFNIRGFRKISHHLPNILIPKPKNDLIIKTIHGFYLIINPVLDNGVEKSIYYTGTYEKGTLHILKKVLKENNVFVDIGANIGLMSILSSSIVKNKGCVYSFEPNPNTYKILKENISINNISNIELSRYAIGNKSESSVIYDNLESNRGSSSLIKPEVETDKYDIEVVRLSDYFENKDIKIDLIKADIEGYELEALNGAIEILKRDNPPMLIVECSEIRDNVNDNNREELFNFITKVNKYKIFKLQGGKSRKSKLIEISNKENMPMHDNIFCFTYSHLNIIPKNIFK